MAKKPTALRTTITVPADLKKRMEKVRDPVNWSAIAAEAFERKLAELAAKKATKDIQGVVERLRAARRVSENEWFEEGWKWGGEWARAEARPVELERLEQHFNELKESSTWRNFFEPSPGETPDYRLHCVIFLSDEDPLYVHFWHSIPVTDETRHKSDFARGFAEGALDIWWKVKDLL